ncbi:MAG: group 1 truncated hemoglobin [Deltaproteobacteria bacterium]|nr:group 1 truncated hemoglobin [Deltaproteobacteria bacterium]
MLGKVGGLDGLRPIVADLVARLCRDPMIGFHFAGVDPVRLTDLELQFAAQMLGADVPYEGRPIATAHARHPITGGHFARRTHLLRQVLADHDVPQDVRQAWLAHTERLRPAVLGKALMRANLGPCDHPGAGALVTEVAADGSVQGARDTLKAG